MQLRDPTPDEPYAIAIMVPQFLTEAVMRERLAELGHRPQYGVELNGFVQDADGVSARISSAEGVTSFRARYLVGADGGGSLVRRRTSTLASLVKAWISEPSLRTSSWRGWVGMPGIASRTERRIRYPCAR